MHKVSSLRKPIHSVSITVLPLERGKSDTKSRAIFDQGCEVTGRGLGKPEVGEWDNLLCAQTEQAVTSE